MSGTPQSYEEYRHAVGVVKGLRLAEEHFKKFTDYQRRLEEGTII